MTFDYQPVTKAVEKRYTFGVMYPADTVDAHGEFAKADTLQDGQWAYVRSGNRSIYLQHGATGLDIIGEYVDIVTWPMAQKATFTKADGSSYEADIPAGSIWMGVLWNERGWQLIKSGKLRGLSMGGTAGRKAKDWSIEVEQDLSGLPGYDEDSKKRVMHGV
jgi:hypothetical protein